MMEYTLTRNPEYIRLNYNVKTDAKLPHCGCVYVIPFLKHPSVIIRYIHQYVSLTLLIIIPYLKKGH